MEERSCDICGRSESTLIIESQEDSRPGLQVDEDGLWMCKACQERLWTRPVVLDDALEIDGQLRALVGKSAGAICRTLELPLVPPYKTVLEAASKIAYDQDLFMSAWLFVTQWGDGTTAWREPAGQATALVMPDGTVNIQNA